MSLIFDGHNDVLSKLMQAGGISAAPGFIDGRDGHIDVGKARRGGLAGGFFAIWCPSPIDLDAKFAEMTKPAYDMPLPDPIPREAAMDFVSTQAAILFELERLGGLRVCRSAADIRAAMADGVIAAIFHIEGAEAIDPDFHSLDLLHAAGLRSLGPVWSRDTIFGHGVPFRYPSSPDTGPGLSDAGKRLVRHCNARRIMLDLSHLNEAGFRDVAALSDAPLVATHSNAHAICAHARNLTDLQLDAIRDSDGMVGLNFAVAFLRDDGRMVSDVPLTQMLRHLDHLIARLGEDRVGIGSDFDGALIPDAIGDATGLCALTAAMRDHGYGDDLIEKLNHGNWLRVLEKTWGG